jgi:hypothetical protein
MTAFQLYNHSEKQRKVAWVGDDSHVVFGRGFRAEKGSVRRCVVAMQQPDFVAKVRGEVFAHFHKVAVKSHGSMRN